jgi:hypothetical protein
MKFAREVVAAGHAKRKLDFLPLKQPLALLSFEVPGDFVAISDEIWDVILEELNTYNVCIGEKKVYPQKKVTISARELKELGDTRSLVRNIQMMRKEKGCTIHEKIKVQLPKEYETLPEKLLDTIRSETIASLLTWGDTLLISTG